MENLDDYPDRVAELYKNKTILITGGTGFIGKVLIEKLLRSCTDLKKIYLLVRTKKGKNPKERIKDIFNGPLFEMVKKQRGAAVFDKVEVIPGDISVPDLDLSPEDRKKLTGEVEIIYHCAATVRFDEGLKKAVILNVRGTKLILELAKECKKLLVYCHLSTAYCHLNERVLYEKAYPPPADPHKVIKTCELMDEKDLDNITDKILGDIPNTYAFTKALGEALVNDEMDNLPAIILRPSIVLPIWKGPIPGWTDNINGPTGLLIGAGKGVIRTMYCQSDTYADYVPVDIVVNAVICCVFLYLTYHTQRYYNITSSAEHKVSFEEMINMGRDIVSNKIPFNWVLWYPGGSMKKSKFIHLICFILYQLIPALFIDGILMLLGFKPILMKVQKRIHKGYDMLEYYTNNQWDFNNDDSMKAREHFNPKEKMIYKLDGDGLDYYDYFTHCVHAARLYILKETDDTIPTARRHMQVMWFVDKICKILIALGFFYFLWTKIIVSMMP